VVIDWDGLLPELREQGLEVPPERLALMLKDMARFLGGELELIAVVPDRDQGALLAFTREHFRILPVEHNRHRVLNDLQEELAERVDASREPPFCLTLVSEENAFSSLAWSFAKLGSQVRVLGTSRGTGHELRKREYNFQALERLLHGMRRKRVVVLIDAENIVYSLREAGMLVDIPALVQAFKDNAIRHGQLLRMIAAADWELMAKSLQLNAQRQFEEERVETLYEISMRGKSSSDMRIVDKAHELLQSNDPPDIFILTTGDRDFRKLIETIQQRGKKVIVWGKKGTVSPRVSEIADVMEWVEDFLVLPSQPNAARSSEPTAPAAPLDPLVDLALQVEGLAQLRAMPWVSPGRLLETLAPGQVDTTAQAAAKSLLTRAKAEGVLIGQQRPNLRSDAARPTIEALSLNPANPQVQTARLIIERVRVQLRDRLEVLPFVTFSVVASTLERDPELRAAGLARTRPEQMHLLNRLVEIGFMVKVRRTTPYNCTTLILPPERPAPIEADDQATMIRRIITAADAWMAQRNMPWVGLKGLHLHLGKFGDSAFREAIDQLIRDGEAESQQHENPRGPHPVRGLHLNPQGGTVAAVRQEREQILATLRRANQPLSVEQLQAASGDPGNHCTRWASVLSDEGALFRQEGAYALNHTHILVRGEIAAQEPRDANVPEPVESGTLRDLITEALNDEELTALTHDYFLPVYEQFTGEMSRTRKVHLLVEHVIRRNQIRQLLDRASKYNAARVTELAARWAA
jgi:uncharacterized LabA/DUF88 family protein